MAGIYVHIPFCESRCIYCGFYSTTHLDKRKAYIEAVCREIELRKNYLTETAQTIYLGGGTPSTLPINLLQQLFSTIFEVFDVAPNAEITMECNPDDVTEAFCDQLHTLPINRISMGAQTFSDERLRFLRRRHRARDVADAVARLRKAGIQNISIDLMFGFPEETLQEWKSDIEQALALNVEHLSAYSLMYEEGTPLYHLLEQGRVTEMDEELYRQMYDALIEHLTAAGYEHYEISNFARPGHRSHHNSSYWADVPYIGLGAAAHSYNVKTRSWNCENLDAYIQGINNGRLPSESEEIDETTHYNDLIITALRTREGLSLRKLTQNQRSYVMKTLEKKNYLQRLRLENDRLSLTREGIYVSDSIMADLMWPTPENI